MSTAGWPSTNVLVRYVKAALARVAAPAGAAAVDQALAGSPPLLASLHGQADQLPLFAAASARYGRQVAFLGADTDDSAGMPIRSWRTIR
ncbi:MAG: hypothetical protein ACLQA5_19135 [Solirubrobacteraceae bacterium]